MLAMFTVKWKENKRNENKTSLVDDFVVMWNGNGEKTRFHFINYRCTYIEKWNKKARKSQATIQIYGAKA